MGAQVAVDTETHLIVARDVTNQGFDRHQLAPMATAAKTALGRDDLHTIADKGYFSGSEILACHQAGITTTVPRPETSGNRSKGMFVKADFHSSQTATSIAAPPATSSPTAIPGRKAGYRSGDTGSTTASTARFSPAAPPARSAGSRDGSTSTWSTRCGIA
jgi:hypothetical protein